MHQLAVVFHYWMKYYTASGEGQEVGASSFSRSLKLTLMEEKNIHSYTNQVEMILLIRKTHIPK